MPLRLYFADFDKNGSVDPLMTFAVQGKETPFLSRDELAGQMYRKKALFTTHESFSVAVLADILTPEEISQAEIITAETLDTQLFTLETGKFNAVPLPVQAQYAPINAMVSIPGASGQRDLLLLGNLEKTRLKIGPLDANQGLLVEYNAEKKSWRAVPQLNSGLTLDGQVSSAQRLGSEVWIGIRNRGLMSIKLSGEIEN
jgi:hypothetical protein